MGVPPGLAEPEQVGRAFAEAWADRDARALAGLFAQDADFVNVVGLWWRSRDRIEQAHAYGFERIFGASTMTVRAPRTRRLGTSAAVVHVSWAITGQVRPDGSAAGPRAGIFLFVLERGPDGRWLVVAAQNTDTVPGADSLTTDPGGSPGTSAAAYRDP
ncbi:SgcJ/EcaC family oxidoreductase [Ornithinimicrobium avium]|uniref:SgcJ/EcaC family oxidoreductase n=1 Tax=Ornithinimicrobium avium TaxID=2283195 RepID=A0A345NKK9_9MICO|nr:SgcJ/EcaC family oxidoreductase [Ornithinimicrobium avium]AXH95567.1 SgcJ/EcaC family oxidoreductase [Ornithinimicrobium avium]